MKNKGLIALVFIFVFLIGGAFLIGNAPKAQACGDYYGDCGDYYGYDDCYYGCDDYSYDDYCDYGCDDYSYGDYYGYNDYCDYGCDDYSYDYPSYDYCDYGCGDTYDYPVYDDCYYGYGCGTNPTPPVQPNPIIVNNDNNNTNNNNNSNVSNNNNVNNNSIVIRNYVGGGYSEPIVRDREVAVRETERALICTPASQSAPINQSVSLSVSGGTGTYSWSAPGSQNISGRGTNVQLRYPTAGLKTITVSSGGQTATCFVQVTGGQVLAEFIELPNTGAGGINALMPNILAIGGAVLGVILGLVFFVRRAIIA